MTIILLLILTYAYSAKSLELLIINIFVVVVVWLLGEMRKGEVYIEIFKGVNYVIFLLIPSIEYMLSIDRFAYLGLNDSVRIEATIYLLIFNLSCLFFELVKNKKKNQRSFVAINEKSILASPTILIAICLFCLLSTLYIYDFNLEAIVLRGGGRGEVEIGLEGLWFSIFNNVVRPMPLLVLIFIVHYQIKVSKVVLFAILTIGVLGLSPFSSARYLTGAIYLTLLYVIINRKSDRLKITAENIVLILLGPFLLFDLARTAGDGGLANFDYWNLLNVGHFDAFGNAIASINNVEKSWGYGVLGAVLFFVPRSIWESKPVGTGYGMMEGFGEQFKNISMPYFIEGYHNFDVMGLVVFAMIFVMVFQKLKNRVDLVLDQRKPSIYYVTLSFHIVFLFRGDLNNGVSYGVALIIACIAAENVLKLCGVKFERIRYRIVNV